MSTTEPEVNIYASYDEFCEKNKLPLPKRVELDRTKVNQAELKTIKEYFTNLCIDLTLYGDLFTKKSSVETLNQFNSLVFCRIQRAYLEKLCLSIACLLDPAQTGNNKNLSLARIIEQCNSPELTEKYSDLEELYVATGIKQWRRKVLAHNDLSTFIGHRPLELKLEHSNIENIVELIQEIFDDITYPTVHTDIRVVLPRDKDAHAFIHKLQLALEKNA